MPTTTPSAVATTGTTRRRLGLKEIHLAAHFPGVNNTTVWSDPASGSHIDFSSFGDPALAASLARAVCSRAATSAAAAAVQVHGGIGFTWEHPVYLYFKRAFTDAALLGGADEHEELIADLVLERV